MNLFQEPDELPIDDQVAAVVAHYQKYKPRFRSGKKGGKIWNLIKSRLDDGYAVQDLCDAIDGNFASPFHCGENERQREYHDPTLIFRDAGKVSQFMDLRGQAGAPVLTERTQKNVRAGEEWLESSGRTLIYCSVCGKRTAHSRASRLLIQCDVCGEAKDG